MKKAIALIIFFFCFGAAHAKLYSVKKSNYSSITSRGPLVVFLSLGCDAGGYASKLFGNMVADIRGANFGVMDANQAYKITKYYKYDLGDMMLIKDGQVVATTYKKNLPRSRNHSRRWLYDTFKEHGIQTSLKRPAYDRLSPQTDNSSSVNLKKGLVAWYKFNDSPLSSGGKARAFRTTGGARITSQHYFSDGKYGGTGGTGGKALFDNGFFSNKFTFAFNFKLNKAGENMCSKGLFFTGAYRTWGVGSIKGKLFVELDMGSKGGSYSYLLPKARVKVKKWHTIVVAMNRSQRRINLYFDGRRLKDINMTDDMYNALQKFEPYSDYDGASFQNYGCGAVLNGYADNLVVFKRRLNSAEVKKLYNKIKPAGSSDVNDVNIPDVVVNPAVNKQLIKAAAKGRVARVKAALKAGANVDHRYKRWTALMLASYYGHKAVVQALIKANADVSLKVGKFDALKIAEHAGKTEIAQILTDYSNTERFYNTRSITPQRIKHRSFIEAPGVK